MDQKKENQFQKEIRIFNEERESFLDGKLSVEKFKQIISATRAAREWVAEARKCAEMVKDPAAGERIALEMINRILGPSN